MLLYMDAPSFVDSDLWEVDDRSTATLMRGLYKSLAANGGDGASALRKAQLDVRDSLVAGRHPYEQPFFWAGFSESTR
jgi:CHAT domain-containing protein